MADVGDVAIQGSDTERNYARITGAARRIAERGALMVAIGGDHSISYPLGRGMEPLGEFDVVHVDAHADFLDELGGARHTGASQLRRLAELPFVRHRDRRSASAMSTGRRSTGLREYGGRWATSLELIDRGAAEVVRRDRAARQSPLRVDRPRRPRLLDRPRARSRSPAGSSYRQLRATLVEVARRGRVIGFDVVELNPARDLAASHRAGGHLDHHALSQRDL